MEQLSGLNPSAIRAFGYWGEPSASAVTPYKRLCFAAFSIRKRKEGGGALQCSLELPVEILGVMGRSSR